MLFRSERAGVIDEVTLPAADDFVPDVLPGGVKLVTAQIMKAAHTWTIVPARPRRLAARPEAEISHAHGPDQQAAARHRLLAAAVVENDLAERLAGLEPRERVRGLVERVHRVDHRGYAVLGHQRG